MIEGYQVTIYEAKLASCHPEKQAVELIIRDLSQESDLSHTWMEIKRVGSSLKRPVAILLNKSDLADSRNILFDDLGI